MEILQKGDEHRGTSPDSDVMVLARGELRNDLFAQFLRRLKVPGGVLRCGDRWEQRNQEQQNYFFCRDSISKYVLQ